MKLIRNLLLCCFCVLLLAACGGGDGSSAPPQVFLDVEPTTGNVMVGQQIQLRARIFDVMGNVFTGPVVTWTSSNTAVATVDSTGRVLALALGQATITATGVGRSQMVVVTTTTGLNFATVSAGGRHTCGVTSAGAAYCWGDNSSGQLGDGTMTNTTTPVLVSGGLSFAIVSAGGNHTCGVTSGGAAYCWGDNSSGQLGNGTTTNAATPVQVSGGLNFAMVSVGGRHTCGTAHYPLDIPLPGLTNAYCWGFNGSGQLGNGTTANSAIPVPVSGALPFLTDGPNSIGPSIGPFLAAGGSHTCGVTVTLVFTLAAPVVCWGDNSSGQLGNGGLVNSPVPVAIEAGPGSWGGLAAGGNHTCAGVYGYRDPLFNHDVCWGDNSSGQLGDGTTTSSAVPVAYGAPLRASAGTLYTCAAGYAGSLASCWGNNDVGQLGNGTTTSSATPVSISGGLNFATVSAGDRHACGVTGGDITNPPTAPGAVYCWGDNAFGQLGISLSLSSSVTINVAGQP